MKTSHKNSLRHVAVFVTAVLFSHVPLVAQSEALPNSPSPKDKDRADEISALSRSDRSFLEKAIKASRKEVEVSGAVASRVSDPQVKALAQMVIADHTSVNTELVSLAARKGVTLPPENMKAGEKWSKKTKDLDDDYLKEMKDDHEDAVKLYEKGLKSDDPDIAAFARKTLPSLEHHLSMVKEVKKAN